MIRRVVFVGFLVVVSAGAATARERWSAEQARAWQAKTGWLVGCNYAPRSAINQLEMWQAETFDAKAIDEELGWAEELGFNSVRVFLHHLLWEQDAEGFCGRIDRFLEIAARHKIGVMLVLFDGVWDPHPQLGTQRQPRPHVHNSGWVQSPGAEVLADAAKRDSLRTYVVGIVGRFKNNPRVQVWDLFNEPDNPNSNAYGKVELANKAEVAQALLEKTFVWARSVDPAAPLSAGVWRGDWRAGKMSPIDKLMTDESDVISFHTYDPLPQVKRRVASLERFERPLICTEFMARGNGSHFDPILGYFKAEGIGAYSWGFVSGKSQTIYPWDSWQRTYTAEPEQWFHDIFRADGTPYRQEEVEYIRRVTGK